MTTDDKKVLADEVISLLEELKNLYTIEINDNVITRKKDLKEKIKTLLDKSELLFDTKGEKYFYDIYMHFGLFRRISRKEITKYLTETFDLSAGSIKSYIRTLERHYFRNTFYANWRQEDIYHKNKIKYPQKKFDAIKSRWIKGDKSDQFVLVEIAVLRLVKNKGLDVRDEDAARFAKMFLEYSYI